MYISDRVPRCVDGVGSAGRAGGLRARSQRYKGVDNDVRRRHVDHGMAKHVCPAFAKKEIRLKARLRVAQPRGRTIPVVG